MEEYTQVPSNWLITKNLQRAVPPPQPRVAMVTSSGDENEEEAKTKKPKAQKANIRRTSDPSNELDLYRWDNREQG
jgi:hypothetical protein